MNETVIKGIIEIDKILREFCQSTFSNAEIIIILDTSCLIPRIRVHGNAIIPFLKGPILDAQAVLIEGG